VEEEKKYTETKSDSEGQSDKPEGKGKSCLKKKAWKVKFARSKKRSQKVDYRIAREPNSNATGRMRGSFT